MSTKFVVCFDGSEVSRRALDFAVDRAKMVGATVVVAHVLEWSPYTFLTPTELEERHKRRTEELARAEAAIMTPIKAELTSAGVEYETVIKYGHIAEKLCEIAKDAQAIQMFVGRTGHSGIAARVFGSVAGTLAQIAPVPCTIVP